MERAGSAAARAIELDPELPEVHVAKGLAHLYHDWDFVEARAELEEAMRLSPSHADAHRWAEFYFTYVEYDYDEASAALARSRIST